MSAEYSSGAAVVPDVDLGHLPAGRAGFQTLHVGVGEELDVFVLQGRRHAQDLGVGLAVDQAREAVEAVAADTGARVRHLAVVLVEQDAERQGKR